MKAGKVFENAALLLTDTAQVRWSAEDKLRWLNEGQLAIAAVVPSASSKRATIDCVAGIEQTIPVADGMRLLSVLHNINTDGTPGRVITVVTRSEMNDIRASWPGQAASAVARHYVYDDDQPKIFEVWPPSPVVVSPAPAPKIRLTYAARPADCEDEDSDLSIDPVYSQALTDWVCYRCYMQDSDDPNDGQRAANHLAAFQQALGVKTEVDKTAVPKRK